MTRKWIFIFAFLFVFLGLSQELMATETKKEWTFMVFINGVNDLDDFGYLNINQMEEVGATDQINILVQHGTLKDTQTHRYFITQDNDRQKISSPTVELLGTVDMGDKNELAHFISWGMKNYPAKKYFVAIWNHGSGWHRVQDISYDDRTGNRITTEELGTVLRHAAAASGSPIELVGADACVMSLIDVTSAFSDSAHFFVGSQELEPGEGWPYHQLLQRWKDHPEWSGKEVGSALAEEYLKSYSGGSNGQSEVTLSVFDLSFQKSLERALADLVSEVQGKNSLDSAKLEKMASNSLFFYNQDYLDLGNFLSNLNQEFALASATVAHDILNRFVVSNQVSETYRMATGVSVWVPRDEATFTEFRSRYAKLQFNQTTQWLELFKSVYSP